METPANAEALGTVVGKFTCSQGYTYYVVEVRPSDFRLYLSQNMELVKPVGSTIN